MILINEALSKKEIMSELEISTVGNEFKIVARSQKRGQKLHEHEFYFTHNGISALIGNLEAIQKIAEARKED
ncbi:hypothetical protein FC89_GL000306 [Liquorilactobacillus ghanensis DSM 18630]|uniref:Uncharacterized protein n=1 Tax=Liquorilactobacillus ghanensis DSM 18630 TaxID=1423750 RepID=A0A0R1VNN0_9LACO|nr:hypothetical protein [Liquorilactobacillus ghanensis]KRM06997.1 hypothetical protein FC89_GL000306 [Liquorilactobacillus ghanensis DSM 18630]